MYNKKRINKMKGLLCALVVLSSFGVNNTAMASSEDYYLSDTDNTSCADGGKLISYSERQKYGKLTGNSRRVKFYTYAKYDGSTKVKEIKLTWHLGAKMRSCCELTATVSLTNKEYGVSATYKQAWQNCNTVDKYWSSTNGAKVEYENSNYVISPDADLKGFQFWINSTAYVELKGYAHRSTISTGV